MSDDSGRSVLFLLGASHRSAAMELREKLFIEADELKALLPVIRERFGFLELAALSTCNRFELLGLAKAEQATAPRLAEAYLALQRAASGARAFSDDDVRRGVYLHVDDAAVAHVYRVAASLDSLVLGETQITGQFKDALALAGQARTIGPTLGRLGQEALATAKKVRTQTAIGKKHVSISHAAIDLAKRVFGDLAEHRILLIGAGEMSQVAARYIQGYRPRALYVANRPVERAAALTEELGFGEPHSLEELPRLLTLADVVISSTAAPGYVIDQLTLKRAMGARRGRPMTLVDIAMPRDIDPTAGKIDDVYLFDIDDLKQVVDANAEERQKAAVEAERLVERGVELFSNWRQSLAVGPALKAFRDYVDGLVRREGAKTLAREHFREMSDKQRESLEAMLAAIAAKIAGDASRIVRQPPDGYFSDQLADSLIRLFALDRSASEPLPNEGDAS